MRAVVFIFSILAASYLRPDEEIRSKNQAAR
jgi:hypothetical protein